MFLAYVFSLVVGGVFLGVSALLGAKDVGHDIGGHDVGGHGVGGHHGASTDKDSDTEATWLPFLSLQFWMFALAFFGLTGTVLQGFGIAGPIVTFGSAAALG